MNPVVRDYQVSDRDACLAIFDSNIPDYFDQSERDMFADFLNGPSGFYFVIAQDGQVCACGGYAKEDRGQARFTWGMAERGRHGQGLGRLLAEHRLAEITASGLFQEIELFTTPIIAPFFQKFGFTVKETRKDGFAPGMDQVQMIKWLD
ncbi:GNAT family N-acetyltransferase [Parasphingorhabdus sp.]|uniref:GNAT family N-acetyltransferase n=1 Tax=Parasphingorhabdus sp. TaxID=2709688 RepID=UPI003265CE25